MLSITLSRGLYREPTCYAAARSWRFELQDRMCNKGLRLQPGGVVACAAASPGALFSSG